MNRNLRQNHRLSKTIGRRMNYRGREQRKLFDTNVENGKDLYDASRNLGQMHPMSSDPNSLASHMINSLVRVPDSIPNNTFKNGAYPHTFTTMSIMDYPEPDTQPLQPNLSPLEFIGLRTMEHHVPGDAMCKLSQYPTTFAQGLDARVMGKTPTSTTDAVPIKERKRVPFQSTYQTTSSISTMKDSRVNINNNKSIMVGTNPYKAGMAGQAAVDRAFPIVRPGPSPSPALQSKVKPGPVTPNPVTPNPQEPNPETPIQPNPITTKQPWEEFKTYQDYLQSLTTWDWAWAKPERFPDAPISWLYPSLSKPKIRGKVSNTTSVLPTDVLRDFATKAVNFYKGLGNTSVRDLSTNTITQLEKLLTKAGENWTLTNYKLLADSLAIVGDYDDYFALTEWLNGAPD
jgi:hypothetical protein